MNLPPDKALDIYIYCCLAQQLEAYSYVFKGVLDTKGKARLELFQVAAKRFARHIEGQIDLDKLNDDAEAFDKALRMMRSATGIQKMQLWDLFQAWTKGQVRVEEQHQPVVMEAQPELPAQSSTPEPLRIV